MTTVADYLKLLNVSWENSQAYMDGHEDRLVFLADCVFNYTTYDPSLSRFLADKTIDVCAAINNKVTHQYIDISEENYRWYITIVNMPFFHNKLDWGTSIRGAWWVNETIVLKNCDLWDDDTGAQIFERDFTKDEWTTFIQALVQFATEEETDDRTSV